MAGCTRAPEAVARPAAVGAADADGRRQPGHHADAQHGDHRLDDRRRRPRLRRAAGAARAEDRRGDGSRPRHRRAGHRARPAEPGGGARNPARPAASEARQLLAAPSQSDAGARPACRHHAAQPRSSRPSPRCRRRSPSPPRRSGRRRSNWITVNFFDAIEAFRVTLLLYVLNPVRAFCEGFPWLGAVLPAGLAGYQLGGVRLAALVAALTAFCAVTGLWEKTMATVYLCGISAFIACLIGIPLGLAARRAATASSGSSRRSSTRCRRCRPSASSSRW